MHRKQKRDHLIHLLCETAYNAGIRDTQEAHNFMADMLTRFLNSKGDTTSGPHNPSTY